MSQSLLFGVLGLILGGAVVAVVMMARLSRVASERAALAAQLASERRSAQEHRELITQSHTQLRETFAALSQDALRENRQDFLRNADAMLGPVKHTLERVQGQLADVDKAREGSYREVSAQLTALAGAQRELREAADGLSRSLRSPHARGRWGEIQLRRIVELAGMAGFCDFQEKPTTTGEDGSRQTPDLIVRLPGDAIIVVDSKVPIAGYLSATEAKTDQERDVALAAHLRQVREHVRTLGSKEYWRQFPTSPEFVVMFLPLEPLLSAALEQEPALLDQAAGLRVIPATPMTLLALLKAAALGWRQEQVARNAEEIQLIGRDLYDRLRTMVAHLEAVGRNIKQAGDAYDRFVGSLEQKVLPGARRFRELGVHAPEEIETTEQLRLSVRPITRPELLDQSDELLPKS